MRSRMASLLKPPKTMRVDGADARAGQHGVGQLGDHGHVDADPVALAHAVGLQHVGHPGDLVLELRGR